MHIIVFLCTLLFCQYLLPVLQVAEECFFGGSGRIILFGSSDGSEIEAQIGSGGKKNKSMEVSVTGWQTEAEDVVSIVLCELLIGRVPVGGSEFEAQRALGIDIDGLFFVEVDTICHQV